MPMIAEYEHALLSACGFALLVMILNFVSANQKRDLPPGATPEPDYANKAYRSERAYQNALEAAVLLAVLLPLAILVGVNPLAVNILISIFFVARTLMAYIHIRGVGKAEAGLRSMSFALALFTQLILLFWIVVHLITHL